MNVRTKQRIRDAMKLIFYAWGTTSSAYLLMMFMTAYMHGNRVLVTINDFGEAELEFWLITLAGGIAFVGGLMILQDFIRNWMK